MSETETCSRDRSAERPRKRLRAQHLGSSAVLLPGAAHEEPLENLHVRREPSRSPSRTHSSSSVDADDHDEQYSSYRSASPRRGEDQLSANLQELVGEIRDAATVFREATEMLRQLMASIAHRSLRAEIRDLKSKVMHLLEKTN